MAYYFKSSSVNTSDIAAPGATIGHTLSSLSIIQSITTGVLLASAFSKYRQILPDWLHDIPLLPWLLPVLQNLLHRLKQLQNNASHRKVSATVLPFQAHGY